MITILLFIWNPYVIFFFFFFCTGQWQWTSFTFPTLKGMCRTFTIKQNVWFRNLAGSHFQIKDFPFYYYFATIKKFMDGFWVISNVFSPTVESHNFICFVNVVNYINFFLIYCSNFYFSDKCSLEKRNFLYTQILRNILFSYDFHIYVHKWYWPIIFLLCSLI